MQTNNFFTPETIAKAVADNVKTGRWLSGTFTIESEGQPVAVGVKAFGRWVQRIECRGMVDGVPEQKTLRDLKSKTADMIHAMLAKS